MALCRDCKYWKPIENEENMGDCFGHKVPGDTDAGNCPTSSFTPRE